MRRNKNNIKKTIKKKISLKDGRKNNLMINRTPIIKIGKNKMNDRDRLRIFGTEKKDPFLFKVKEDNSIPRPIRSGFVNKNIKKSCTIPIEERKPISIIVTAYQTQDFIEEALDSIENQIYFNEFNNYEILIGVDGCQKTLEKLFSIRHKYRNLRIFMMESNRGTYITTNTLLDIVKYENILRFDSDDIMIPEMINEIMLYVNDYDIIKFCYYNFKGNYNKNNNKMSVSGGVIYYSKKIIDKYGGYLPWVCAADGELLKRFKNNNENIFLIKKHLFYRRLHNKNLTQNIKTGMKSKIRKKYHEMVNENIENNIIKINRVVNNYIEK